MIDPIKFKASVSYNKEVEKKSESPNPLRLKCNEDVATIYEQDILYGK